MKFVSFYGGFSNQVARDIRTVISDNYSLDSMRSSSYSKRRCFLLLFPKESEALLPTRYSNNWCASNSVSQLLLFHIQNQRKDWSCHYIDQLSSNWVDSKNWLCESPFDNFRYLFFLSFPSVSLFSLLSVFSTHICSLSSYIKTLSMRLWVLCQDIEQSRLASEHLNTHITDNPKDFMFLWITPIAVYYIPN